MEEMKNLYELITEVRIKKETPKTPEAKGLSILDQYLKGDLSQQDLKFIKPNGPTIYAFVTNKVKDAIKIGYTDQHPEKRIAQWREIYGKKDGEVTLLGYWSAEEFDKAGERVFFWDHSVHSRVVKKGYLNVSKEEFNDFLSEEGKTILNLHISKEFFRKYKTLIDGKMDYNEADALSDKLIEDIIKEMRENIKNGTADFKTYKFTAEGKTSRDRSDKIWGSPASYSNTELQEDAIKNGVAAIKAGKDKLLMAAVMRFGKTHASYEIVKKMTEKVPEEYWSDPTKTFCEPCFGNGQFVVYIIWNRIKHGIDWETALRTCYGVELMQDNVYETHGRLIRLLDALGIDYDEDVAFDIMLENLVCSDFFDWDFENWRPKK